MRVINTLKRRSQSGDTIIEVMIVLAVLSMAFGMSYATATKGLRQSRAAQEHSQALGIINEQIERIRSLSINADTTVYDSAGTPFCVNDNLDRIDTTADIAKDTNIEAPNNACVTNDLYRTTVTYNQTTGLFKATTIWAGIGDLNTQKETMSYKIFKGYSVLPNGAIDLNEGAGGGGGGGTTPPNVVDPTVGENPYPEPPYTPFRTITLNGSDGVDLCYAFTKEGDGYDGCFKDGTNGYMLRNSRAVFALPADNARQGKVNVVVTYRQATWRGLCAPPNYDGYKVNVGFTNSSTTRPIENTSSTTFKPVNMKSGSCNNVLTSTFTMDLPTSGASYFTLEWANDASQPGYDANYMFQKVEITDANPTQSKSKDKPTR